MLIWELVDPLTGVQYEVRIASMKNLQWKSKHKAIKFLVLEYDLQLHGDYTIEQQSIPSHESPFFLNITRALNASRSLQNPCGDHWHCPRHGPGPSARNIQTPRSQTFVLSSSVLFPLRVSFSVVAFGCSSHTYIVYTSSSAFTLI